MSRELKKSTVIMASAGSGKTFRLSLRFIALAARSEDEAMAARVLATTFSRKAAAEILERIVLRLSVACLSRKKAEELSAELLEHEKVRVNDFEPVLARVARVLHRMQVSTLDSYFARIGSCFRQELDLPSGGGVMEEEHTLVEPVRLEAITDVLEEIELDDVMGLLKRVHSGAMSQTVLGDLTALVREVYALVREAPERALWTRLPRRAERSMVEVEELLVGLEAFSVRQGGPWVKAVEKIVRHARFEEDWSELMGSTLVANAHAGIDTFYKKPIPPEGLDLLRKLADEVAARSVNMLARQTEATWQWAGLFAVKFDGLRRERGMVFFSDVPRKLTERLMKDEALGEGVTEEIYYRLDSRMEHMLLDEFQDTSVQQWGVLKPAAQEILSREEGSVFVVGDVKQAIYGWRGGCPEIFRHVAASLNMDDGALETMDQNWRSSQVILDVVNTVFSGMSGLPTIRAFGEDGLIQAAVDRAAGEWQEAFRPHTAGKKGLPGYVQLRTPPAVKGAVSEEGDDAAAEADGEAQGGGKQKHHQATAEFVRDLHLKHPEKTVCVLVSTNAAGFAILGALRRLGVNASGETGVRIAGDPAVAAVLAALQLCDHPGDKVAGFHLANSPLAKVLGLELHGASAPSAQTAGKFALATRERIAEIGYAGLISQWAKALAPGCSPENLRRLWQLVQLAQEHEALGAGLRPGDLVRAVKQTQVQEPVPAKVRVMTIYRSKGLEFDIVVMPELTRKMGNLQNLKCVVLRETKADRIEAVYRYPNENMRKLAPVEVRQAYCSELRSRLTDELCALYVGMTRAKSALYMLAPVAKKTKNGAQAANRTFLSLLEEALDVDHNETVEADKLLFERGDAAWDVHSGVEGELKAAKQAVPVLTATGRGERSLASVSPSSLEAGATVSVEDLLALEKPVNRRRGVVFHAWFEGVEFVEGPEPVRSAADLVKQANARFMGLPAGELEKWAENFVQVMGAAAVREALLRPSTKAGQTLELWRERDFVVMDDGKMLRGQFDRVVIWRDGEGRALKATLLDFKTDTVTDETVAGKVAGYKPQVEAYLRALARMLGLRPGQVGGELLFVGGEPRRVALGGLLKQRE